MIQAVDARLLKVAAVVVLGAAVAGIVTGTRAPNSRPPTPTPSSEGVVDVALSYAELREQRRGPSAKMYDQVFAWLSSLPGDGREPETQTADDRAAALTRRSERRAYAGAPPTIPHPVQNREVSACLACHEKGATIGTRKAPAMSHKPLTMCTQCHAVASEAVPRHELRPVGEDNLFIGANESGPGSRAWQGAPPTIPHSTMMRENCSSCHGPGGQFGLRTPHPQQISCRQCHATSAEFDPSAPPSFPPRSLPVSE